MYLNIVILQKKIVEQMLFYRRFLKTQERITAKFAASSQSTVTVLRARLIPKRSTFGILFTVDQMCWPKTTKKRWHK